MSYAYKAFSFFLPILVVKQIGVIKTSIETINKINSLLGEEPYNATVTVRDKIIPINIRFLLRNVLMYIMENVRIRA